MASPDDAHWMRLALEEARAGAAAGEVPVGAVVVRGGQVIARAHNAPIRQCDPTAHAEVLALRAAAQALGNYRLEDCTLYVTLEPCAMCAGAALHARLGRVVYASREPRTGAAGSVVDLFAQPALNPHTKIAGGVLQPEATALLEGFFAGRRQQQRAQAQPLAEHALRPPKKALQALLQQPGWDWPVQGASDVPGWDGWRVQWVDEGPADAPLTWVALHGYAQWSVIFREALPVWRAAGHRVIAPDLPGCGRSDQPKKARDWTHARLVEGLQQWLVRVHASDAGPAVLVAQGSAAALAVACVLAQPGRWAGLWLCDPWPLQRPQADTPAGRWLERVARPLRQAALGRMQLTDRALEEGGAWDLPYPDIGHTAVLQAVQGWWPEQAGDAQVLLAAAQAVLPWGVYCTRKGEVQAPSAAAAMAWPPVWNGPDAGMAQRAMEYFARRAGG